MKAMSGKKGVSHDCPSLSWGPPLLRPPRDPQVHDQFMQFFYRWNLKTFLTWDLPVPMQPALWNVNDDSLGSGMDRTRTATGEAGVNLFVPWYLFRDGKFRFKLQEFASHLRELGNPSHLAGWLKRPSARGGRGKRLGDERLHILFSLYRYQKLAIESRYADRPGFGVEQQDHAFAQFLGLSEESVRQVRLHLQKQLSPESGSS